MNFSTEQAAWIIKHYFRSLSCNVVRHRFNEKFGERSLHYVTIMWVVHRFQKEHALKRLEGSGRTCRVQTPENEEEVKQVITANPRLSAQKISRMSNATTGTANTILHSLKLYPYHISVHQELKPPDYTCRVNFCQWFNHFMRQGVDVSDVFSWMKPGFISMDMWTWKIFEFGEWEPSRFCWNQSPSTENWNVVCDITKASRRPIFSWRPSVWHIIDKSWTFLLPL